MCVYNLDPEMVKSRNSARGICRSMTRPGAEKAAYLCKKKFDIML